jgi:hypothetical protein
MRKVLGVNIWLLTSPRARGNVDIVITCTIVTDIFY